MNPTEESASWDGGTVISWLEAFHCKNHFLGKYECKVCLLGRGGDSLMYLEGSPRKVPGRRAKGGTVKGYINFPEKSQ